MESIGNFIALLPGDGWQYLFMQRALVAVVLVSLTFGLLSPLVVSNRLAFFSDALGHSAFTGLALGAILGLATPLTALVAFSILFALLVIGLKQRSHASTDTVLSVCASTAVAIGLMLMTRAGGVALFTKYLVGDVLSIQAFDLTALACLWLLTLAFVVAYSNRLLLLSVNPALARSRGVAVVSLEVMFAVLLAVVVAVAIQWVGLLLINSLLVLPAATARNLTGNVRSYQALSVLTALAAGALGLALAYTWDTTAGATIAAVLALMYLLTWLPRRSN